MQTTPRAPDSPLAALLAVSRTAVVKRLIVPQRLEQVRAAARKAPAQQFWDKVLDELHLSYDCPEAEIARIPAKGPVVVVANHPHGLADGIVLGSLLARVRGDVRMLANSVMAVWDELRDFIFQVDPFGGPAAARANVRGLRQGLEWLRNGGLLVIFPSGEVSSFNLPQGRIVEPGWQETAARLIRSSGAATVPVFLHGTNSLTFHLAGLVHPLLRTVLLPRELIKKQGRSIGVSVGNPIAAASLARYSTDAEAIQYLHWRTHLLRTRSQRRSSPRLSVARAGRRRQEAVEIASPVPSEVCRKEIDALPAEQVLLTQAEYRVCYASAFQIPQTLIEIGRLREISFRKAGEGTGEAFDLDRFDAHYRHLMVWNTQRHEIVGAYRLACTDEVVPRYGAVGLYTSTLFRYRPEFLEQMSHAIELGRSFVQPAYQRSYAPLLLLWKGILQFIVRNPRYRVVFGPVSISNLYTRASRDLMMSYLRNHHGSPGLSPAVAAKHRPRAWFHLLPPEITAPAASDIDQLSEGIADLEPDSKGVPVLIRQYLNFGGQIVDFNVDKNFADVLDALIVVDLDRTAPRTLERYMGKEGVASFRAHQATAPDGPSVP